MKTTRHQVHRFSGLIAGTLLQFLVSENVSAVDSARDLAAQISIASVLYLPLTWVGKTPPDQTESQILHDQIKSIKIHGVASNLSGLEAFVSSHPNSPWLPSLRANLGRYYFEHGQYHKAIEAWSAAWQATAVIPDGAGKHIAEFAFVHLTELLVGLGKVDELKDLFDQTKGRSFTPGPILQKVKQTRLNYELMASQTDASFRCGVYALNSVGEKIKGTSFDRMLTMRAPSPSTGFSLAKLAKLGQLAGVEMVAVQWGSSKALAVPSVVHWKDNHYAAILAERGGLYEVDDTIFGQPRWLSGDDIREEASGYFLVSKKQLNVNWKVLSDADASQVYGRGLGLFRFR